MLIIKNQKLIFLGVFLGLIVFTIPISNVEAIPQETSEVPYIFRTLKGTLVDGITEDVQDFDDDFAHWKGKKYLLWIPYPEIAWIIEPALYYDHPGYTYKYVYLAVNFKYSGTSDLAIKVWYRGGGLDTFYEPSTGGSFVMKYYTLDNYKIVSYISFRGYDNILTGDQQHVYIDCAEVGYASF